MRFFLNTSQEKQVCRVKTGANYYNHGPLSRMETGDNQVQGCDYVYSLQGWIKGVNSTTLNTNNDPGQDGTSAGSVPGNPNALFARDVYGYSLNYFTGDYSAIDANKNTQVNSFSASINASDVEDNRNDLFNGNIGSMVTTITIPDAPVFPNTVIDQRNRTVKPLGNAYKYDQLNRLLQAVSYNNIGLDINDPTNYNKFGTGGTQMYYNAFTYDANGNILTQVRNDHQNSTIDDMQYRYARDGNGKIIQNRLYHVNDDTDYDGNDIDDMLNVDPNQDPMNPTEFVDDLNEINLYNNYSYTEIGELKRDNQEGIAEIVWRVDGKVKEVIRAVGNSRKNLKFEYDAMGNRIAKHIYSSSNNWEKSTFYVRDAQGNVMSVYEETNPSMPSMKLQEQHIYGSSRVGMRTDEKEMIAAVVDTKNYTRELGKKQYEFSNHLGNVLSVITDKKLPIQSTIPTTEVDYFIGEIVSATDFSPFGCVLTEREFTTEKYRYGFNGMENDADMKGEGNSYDYKERFYDNRLGRFLSMDKLAGSFPWYTPYQFAGNKPIVAIDLDGLEEFYMIDMGGDDYKMFWDVTARNRKEGGTVMRIDNATGVKGNIVPLTEKEKKHPEIQYRLKIPSNSDKLDVSKTKLADQYQIKPTGIELTDDKTARRVQFSVNKIEVDAAEEKTRPTINQPQIIVPQNPITPSPQTPTPINPVTPGGLFPVNMSFAHADDRIESGTEDLRSKLAEAKKKMDADPSTKITINIGVVGYKPTNLVDNGGNGSPTKYTDGYQIKLMIAREKKIREIAKEYGLENSIDFTESDDTRGITIKY